MYLKTCTGYEANTNEVKNIVLLFTVINFLFPSPRPEAWNWHEIPQKRTSTGNHWGFFFSLLSCIIWSNFSALVNRIENRYVTFAKYTCMYGGRTCKGAWWLQIFTNFTFLHLHVMINELFTLYIHVTVFTIILLCCLCNVFIYIV